MSQPISSSGQSSRKKKKNYDRFIPHSVSRSLFTSDEKHPRNSNYQELLGMQLLDNDVVPKILKFGDEAEEKENYNPNQLSFGKKQTQFHKLPQQPYRVLPAALLKDDYYLNLLDWADSGCIAVGLQSSLYIWSGCATRVSKVQ